MLQYKLIIIRFVFCILD